MTHEPLRVVLRLPDDVQVRAEVLPPHGELRLTFRSPDGSVVLVAPLTVLSAIRSELRHAQGQKETTGQASPSQSSRKEG